MDEKERKTLKFKENNLFIQVTQYRSNGNLAILAYTDEELYGDITINLPGYSIVEDEENEDAQENIKATLIDDSKLEDYPNQPFKLYDEDKKKEMIESIRNFGIMQPLIVRTKEKREYWNQKHKEFEQKQGEYEARQELYEKQLRESNIRQLIQETYKLLSEENMSKFQRFKRATKTFGDLSKREIKEMIKKSKGSGIDWYNEL